MDFKGNATMYSSQKATSFKKKKNDDDETTKEEPKGDEHIVGLYLRQRVKNL